MKFIIASNNKKKIAELSQIMSEMGIDAVSQSDAGLHFEAEETGTTFPENAYIKAKAACDASGMPAVADDSGIIVDALNGAPGVYSARYGGSLCKTDEDRLNYLMENMKGKTDRKARYACAIVCVFPNGDTINSYAEFEGELIDEKRGNGGFGYDPIFYVPEYGMTAAEMTQEQKNSISHRGKALAIFKKKLGEYYADR